MGKQMVAVRSSGKRRRRAAGSGQTSLPTSAAGPKTQSKAGGGESEAAAAAAARRSHPSWLILHRAVTQRICVLHQVPAARDFSIAQLATQSAALQHLAESAPQQPICNLHVRLPCTSPPLTCSVSTTLCCVATSARHLRQRYSVAPSAPAAASCGWLSAAASSAGRPVALYCAAACAGT